MKPLAPPESFLESLKRQWLAMIDAIEDPLVVIDGDYRVVRQNRSYGKIAKVQAPLQEIPGKKCYEIFAGRSEPCPHCLVKRLQNGPEEYVSWVSERLFEGQHWEVQAYCIPAPEDTSHVVLHYRDITERLRLQETLSQADKLASIGLLAGGVAHELSSPLAGIIAFCQLILSDEKPQLAHVLEDLQQIEAAAQKCKEIIDNLLRFSRTGQTLQTPQEVDVFEELKKALQLTRALLKTHHIRLEMEFLEGTCGDVEAKHPPLADQGKAFIQGSPLALGQIFLNLIINAIHAMPEGGRLMLRGVVEEEEITITVEDTGVGISPENLPKIFDPFFTTKPVGQGTGLGLSITYSQVKQHGGRISVKSEKGQGTVFKVCFPRLKKTPRLS